MNFHEAEELGLGLGLLFFYNQSADRRLKCTFGRWFTYQNGIEEAELNKYILCSDIMGDKVIVVPDMNSELLTHFIECTGSIEHWYDRESTMINSRFVFYEIVSIKQFNELNCRFRLEFESRKIADSIRTS